MARREFLAAAWLERISTAMVAAQAVAWRRRCDTIERRPLASHCDALAGMERAAWVPWLAQVHIAFEGTVLGEGRKLRIRPGRPRLARLRRDHIRWIEVCCDARMDGLPRLSIDGVAVDPTGCIPTDEGERNVTWKVQRAA